MQITNIKALRKEVQQEYINKGYSGERLDSALMNDHRYPKDRLIEVTGYDLENNKILGMLGDKKCEVTMCPTAFATGEEMVAKNINEDKVKNAKWFGHKIDEKMAQHVTVGSQLILQASIVEKNKDTISILTSRVLGVAPANDNTFAGIFSMTNKTEESSQIKKVQHWKPNITGFMEMIDNAESSNDITSDKAKKPKMK